MKQNLTIAISKGRILKEALPLLSKIGIEPVEDLNTSRKLILQTNRAPIQVVVIRATDVPTYVEYGAADLGITGKDVLMEHGSDQLYEPLDLKIAPCRLMLAQIKGATQYLPQRRLRIATKYVNITQQYFNQRGEQVELIKLYGSMELAPLVGLADRIVDLVDTGNTLKANGLEPTELILPVTSRLVVNKASMKMKQAAILQLVTDLKEVL
ncbi:MAG TPA: ATP phosphoribosyltransferase [Gammaproteobacteria bacterium]|nr:ATP phosphoribosyltransferase [Gammaproteobacteria bacterium]